jgi:gamma-resorcylate decarboxylase
MQGKIGLEEHFAIPETLQDSQPFVAESLWPELKDRLMDIQGRRLRLMDEHGMEMMLLSLNAPTVQAIHDTKRATDIAIRANDYLADEVRKRPDRFQGLSALAMQDPDAATRELDRSITQLGFRGVMVNGFSNIGSPESCVYLDDPRYAGFWARLEQLDVPFYLHPRNPIASWAQIYAGHPGFMGPAWAFGQETAVHALRLMSSGLFDRHPKLKIVLGHMGEGIPFNLWRLDHHNEWMGIKPKGSAKRLIRNYFQENFWITTSGNFSNSALIASMLELGADRIMFSTDWPFENIDHAAIWFDRLAISEDDRMKMGRTNAKKLFKLP